VQVRQVGPQTRTCKERSPARLPPHEPLAPESSSNARRAVVRLTPKAETRSASLGNLSPTPISPDSIRPRKTPSSRWYSVPALVRDKDVMATVAGSKYSCIKINGGPPARAREPTIVL